jgi:phosphoglycerate dehydrogenase-like enzyme
VEPKVTILDDYQSVALLSSDWSAVQAVYQVDAVSDRIDDTDRLIERIAGSEVVVLMRERTPFPASLIERLASLRLLVTTGMQNEVVDHKADGQAGVTVCGARWQNDGVPELTIGLMICLARNIAAEDRQVRNGGWQHTIGPQLAGVGKTLGVVGLGRIWQAVAGIAQAIGMNVVAWSPTIDTNGKSVSGVDVVTKDELFASSDFIIVHMRLVNSTIGLIGRAELGAMQKNAYIVNTSRGPIIEEDALVEVLRRRRIAGAALDVFDSEPLPVDHPLRSLPNALLTPHIGYLTTDAYKVFYGDAVEDIMGFRDGNPVRVLS